MKFDEFYSLLTEIKLNPNNIFVWYVMTPKEAVSLNLNYNNFKNLFYFKIKYNEREYVYIVSFGKDKHLDFWNHSTIDLKNLNDEVLSSDLGIFDHSIIFKIGSTLLSIIQHLAKNQGEHYFKLVPPRGANFLSRKSLYKKILEQNISLFLPSFFLYDENDFLVLKDDNYLKENQERLKFIYK